MTCSENVALEWKVKISKELQFLLHLLDIIALQADPIGN